MATFLDVTGLAHCTSIFVFLFVWIVVYSILLYTHALGTNNLLNALMGLIFAIFVVMSEFMTGLVATIAPIMAVIFVFIMLIGVASKSMGADLEAFPAAKGFFIVLLVVIIVITLGVKIKSNVGDPDTTDLSNTMNLLFHPKFIGMVLLFAVAIFTVALLAGGGGHGHGGGGH